MNYVLQLIVYFTFLLTTQDVLMAQTSLAVDKGGRVKRIHFYRGDAIQVKVKGEKIGAVSYIEQIEDSSIILNSRRIQISQIEYIINPRGPFVWTLLSELGMKGGMIYFLLDSGNRLINRESPIVDERTLKVVVP